MATSDSFSRASGSAEALVEEPAATRAPDELWHLILEELDYIGDARLDDRLFRTKAPKRLKPGTIVAIHSILDETICIFSDKKPVAYADINRDSGRTVFAYPAVE